MGVDPRCVTGSRRKREGGLPASTSLLIHPVFLLALSTLLANDHLLKSHAPGVLTGKLSDIAGLVVAPVVLASIASLLRPTGNRGWLIVSSCVVAIAFCAVKLWPAAADAYRVGLGVVQWPLFALLSVPSGASAPPRPVVLQMDATDLLALPAVVVPLVLGRRLSRPAGAWKSHLAAAVLVVSSLALVATSQSGPSVFDTNGLTAIDLTVERPGFEQQIVLTATKEALSGGTSAALVHVSESSEPSNAHVPVDLAIHRIQPDGGRTSATDTQYDPEYPEISWRPFADCPATDECVEFYVLSVSWRNPQPDPMSVVTDISVSVQYDLDQTVPPGADVTIRFGVVP